MGQQISSAVESPGKLTEAYRRASHDEFHLSPGRTHQSAKLLAHALEQTQPVVFCQRREEVLDRAALVGATGVFLQLRDDL